MKVWEENWLCDSDENTLRLKIDKGSKGLAVFVDATPARARLAAAAPDLVRALLRLAHTTWCGDELCQSCCGPKPDPVGHVSLCWCDINDGCGGYEPKIEGKDEHDDVCLAARAAGNKQHIEFPDMGDYERLGSPYLDHTPNPRHVVAFANKHGYEVDDTSLELIAGRWVLDHDDYLAGVDV